MHYWKNLKNVINPIDNMYSFARDENVLKKILLIKQIFKILIII